MLQHLLLMSFRNAQFIRRGTGRRDASHDATSHHFLIRKGELKMRMIPGFTAEASLAPCRARFACRLDLSSVSGVAPAIWMHTKLMDGSWDDFVNQALGFGDTLPQDIGGGSSSGSAGGGGGSSGSGNRTAPDWLCASWAQCCSSRSSPAPARRICCTNLGTKC